MKTTMIYARLSAQSTTLMERDCPFLIYRQLAKNLLLGKSPEAKTID